MLTIRMQRTGRKGHAMFRVVVQDSRQAPTSGKVVAALGSYDPHAKTLILNKEKATFYLEHGAQPSDRAARLLKNEGVKLPTWVKEPIVKERAVRNAEKRRSTNPEKPAEAEEASAEEAAVAEPETPAEEASAEATVAEASETPAETPEAAADESADETPAETEKDNV
ncbi:MAG TPA: 30S ribosomal protein S16 [Candidatus Saccharimonadales bacterium]|nr:30S ribosomal protein S16 [Candidatus Saccharimonadales bacterium]